MKLDLRRWILTPTQEYKIIIRRNADFKDESAYKYSYRVEGPGVLNSYSWHNGRSDVRFGARWSAKRLARRAWRSEARKSDGKSEQVLTYKAKR